MKKLFTILATFAMLCAVGCEEQGGDDVNPNDKPNTEEPSDKPNDGGGNENENPDDGEKPNDGDENDKPNTQEQYKIYVYNLFGWESVYIYVWDKKNLTEYAGKWCGTEMTATEEINGHTYLVYELPEEAHDREIGVIFNNGQGTQTPDWFITFDKDYYMLLLGTYPTIIQDKNNPTDNGYDSLDEIPDTHKIYYTSTDGDIVKPSNYYEFGANLVDNYIIWTPAGSKGVMIFDGEVTTITDAFYNSKLTSISIPDSVTSIGFCAFYGSRSLKSITIPDSVTSIGEGAFSYCKSLTNATISDSVTSIGQIAFAYCSSLVSVTIPDSVTSIGDEAFCLCESLESVTIGNGVTSIGQQAFAHCSSLVSVTIPDSVTSIGRQAFAHCSSLVSVTINGVTSIGGLAFEGCTGELFVNCNIPDGAFCASAFTKATIGEGVTSIGYNAFGDCSSLTRVYCNPTTPPYAHYSCYHSSNGCYDCDYYWRAFDLHTVEGFTIYVPSGSENKYNTARGWRHYKEYIK